ncbi:ACL119Cp [Eremothecium gossypii ATCC 10895]|uniref:ACL119Cp n=1 Tax=Eremothecium gossypii (strain ATCC 10895 / CBS 109.51 / FGSC 9923 / NRRL Y-1056) TaxID=284811 RepID=Q75CN8_EREGS|nr:ACL119Cp [Eremothecium gossypii ATCC 10895]AAS51109.1 ACL119Cp [Eremothecium gossypii ATCC 10895]AEY95399.1 FACL119Cp [Eremothecium gossypii FDAG1]
MHSRNISQIRYLEPAELFRWIKQACGADSQPFQVLDVRGSDYIGGHIAGAWNYPYQRLKHESAALDELRAQLLETHAAAAGTGPIHCVFHCAQSQQRGPASAMRFLRALSDGDLPQFEVWVLRGGFNLWQSMYGRDGSVTEDYVPDIWQWQ